MIKIIKLFLFVIFFVSLVFPISMYFIFAQKYTFNELKKFFIIYFRSI